MQASGMAGEKQGLVDVWKAHHHNAAVASATDDHHAYGASLQEMHWDCMFHGVLSFSFAKLSKRFPGRCQLFDRKRLLASKRHPETGHAAGMLSEMAAPVDVREFRFEERPFPLRHGRYARFIWRTHGALANDSLGVHVVVGRYPKRSRRAGPHVIGQSPNPQLAMTCTVDQCGLREQAPIDYAQLVFMTEEHFPALRRPPPHEHIRRSDEDVFRKDFWPHHCTQTTRQLFQEES